MCKATTLFNQVVSVYHPTISNNDSVKRLLASNLNWVNIEALIEETMAAVGGYDFVDEHHHDFSDGSECKTGSVRLNPQASCDSSYTVRITNAESGAGITKGSIRAVIYNPHTESCTYYYIPADHLNTNLKLTHINGTGSVKCIDATWNKYTNKIKKFEKYKVKDFETLAKM